MPDQKPLAVTLDRDSYDEMNGGVRRWILVRCPTPDRVQPGRVIKLRRRPEEVGGASRESIGLVDEVVKAGSVMGFFAKAQLITFHEIVPSATSPEEARSICAKRLRVQPREEANILGLKVKFVP